MIYVSLCQLGVTVVSYQTRDGASTSRGPKEGPWTKLKLNGIKYIWKLDN